MNNANTPDVAKAGATASAQPRLPDKWDHEADVVIVGYGGAGAIAAVAAHDAGANVLMIEKTPADTPTVIRHTPSTRYCGMQGIEWVGSIEDGVKFLRYATAGMNSDDVLEGYVKKWITNIDWIKSMGGEIHVSPGTVSGEDFPLDSPGLAGGPNGEANMRILTWVPFAEFVKDYALGAPPAWKFLSGNVTKRGIKVLFDTPAKRLITHPVTGEVIGVEATTKGKPVYVKARKAVALTCGGFEHNTHMKMESFRAATFQFYANPANTGDGHVMAGNLGAEMVHMPCISGRAGLMRFPGQATACGLKLGGKNGGWIFVDQYGKRFGNESILRSAHSAWINLTVFDQLRMEYPRIPHWLIFDEAIRKLGRISDLGLGKLGTGKDSSQWSDEVASMYWSDSNEDEIAKGWILKAATIEELAAKIAAHTENSGRMTPASLQETIKKYNAYCASKSDADFSRPASALIPLGTPPYYAVNTYPGGPNTQGGPKKNGKCQAMRANDTVIKRLYCGGELSSLNTISYSIKNVSELFITGRIIGESAAAEKPWE
ncbi:FAD-binding protein [Chloroflexota bacterium]